MVNGAGERFIVKLIKPFHLSQVRVDLDAVDRIIRFPRPDIEVVYRDRWDDMEGVVILMDDHQFALRRWITENQVWYEFDWIPIMAGVAIRLAHAHARNIVHMDLKPSNSLSLTQILLNYQYCLTVFRMVGSLKMAFTFPILGCRIIHDYQ